MTTTTDGLTVPYIVRVERGTMNRGIYDIAVLFDPTRAWSALPPQPQWNGKVVYSFGASTGQPRLQFRTEQNWADNTALSRGFMVVDNSVTDSLYNSNRVLVAETVMMMKEHIVDRYGEIKFTMGNGCSGGSIQQNTVASIYPGLLDGIQPSCDYPDSITTGIEVTDCVLLVNAYVDARMAGAHGRADAGADHCQEDGDQRSPRPTRLPGAGTTRSASTTSRATTFRRWSPTPTGTIARPSGPRNNCLLPAALVYDPVTNPNGTRCGDPDLAAAVWGTTQHRAGVPPATLRAQQTNDNVGVQYGLKALLSGAITPEEFVTLNEKIGGINPDSNRDPGPVGGRRRRSTSPTAPASFRAARTSASWRSSIRAAMTSRASTTSGAASRSAPASTPPGGDHDNQVIWRYGTGLVACDRGAGRRGDDEVVPDDGHVADDADDAGAEVVPERRAHARRGRRRQAGGRGRLLLPHRRRQLHDADHRPWRPAMPTRG